MLYLASDLDGTLVKDEKVRKEDIEAIKRLKAEGHKFIISTGRTFEGVQELIKEHSLEYDYLLLCNGGLIIDKNDNIILDKYIKNEIGTSLVAKFYDYGDSLMYLAESGDTILVENNDNDNSKVIEMFDYFSKKITKEEALAKSEDYKIVSIFTTDKSHERAEVIKNMVKEEYDDHLEVYRNQFFVDIVPKECSKGFGLKKILEIEEKDVDKLYVVGDSYNDISMFNITDNSYTFHEVEEEIKGHAKNVVYHVSDVIEKILSK